MARKKRGAKVIVTTTRRTRSSGRFVEQSTTSEDAADTKESETNESEESCSSGTPQSCNTPVEFEKPPSNLIQHKKFRKFKTMISEDVSNETSGNEMEPTEQDEPPPIVKSESEVPVVDVFVVVESDSAAEVPTDTEMTEIVDDSPMDVVGAVETADEANVHDEIAEQLNALTVSAVEVEYVAVTDVAVKEEASVDETMVDTEETELTLPTESEPTSDVEREEILCVKSPEQDVVPKEESPEEKPPPPPPPVKEEDEKKEAKPEPISKHVDVKHTKHTSSHSSKVTKVPTKAQLKSMDIPSSKSSSSSSSHKSEKKSSSKEESSSSVRRSSRIKSISVLKQRSKGRGLVKFKSKDVDTKHGRHRSTTSDGDGASENSNSGHNDGDKVPMPLDSPNFLPPGSDPDLKPVKVKSRWRRSSELEMGGTSPNVHGKSGSPQTILETSEDTSPSQTSAEKSASPTFDEEMEIRLKQFQHLKENQYLTDRLSCKEAKKMICDCFLTEEEIKRGEYGCGEDCLNRLLMIECGNYCVVGDRCTNKRFQKLQYSPCEVFRTEKKGFGIRATANIPYGEFILEYVGEVLDSEEFDRRAKHYSKDKNRHYYFMALRADTVIDATQKGNVSRFINHSCEPNAETQKWTVNGELRIGFFSTRTILAGEEITFDYQFQRYGKEAQKCYCEASTCRGWIGEEPDDDEDDEEDEEEEEEEEEEEADVEEKELGEKKRETPGEEVVKKAPVPAKRKYTKKKITRKSRKEIIEDIDLGDEIELLFTTGLKNQAHTLKLSRLMVRAKEPRPRMQLLRLIRHGELPCRRLFLDYHGLRLMHGWMTDVPNMPKTDQLNEAFCLEMLQTLAVLPVSNKTVLQDSKVLQMVEKWSVMDKKQNESPVDSSSNSPNMEQSQAAVEVKLEPVVSKADDKEKIKKEQSGSETPDDTTMTVDDEIVEAPLIIIDESIEGEPKVENMEIEVKTEEFVAEQTKLPEVPKRNYQAEIVHLALKLLEGWLILKEVFRIPKKERIEQMKEHEREADRGYKAGMGLGSEQDGTERKSNRYRSLDIRRIEKVEPDRNRKGIKIEERHLSMLPRISKYERRKLFAMKVEQEEADRRRKHQEMWRQHEHNCLMMGTDPRLTAPYDPNRGYQCFWNSTTGQWQNFTPNAPNQPPMFIVPQPPPMIQNNSQYQMMQQHQAHVNPAMSAVPALSYQPSPQQQPIIPQPCDKEDPSMVKFMGPIPAPVKIPPKWKCAKDKYGRPYYYHVKVRKPQWEPPQFDMSIAEEQHDSELLETSSSSESSSLTSDTSSDSDDEDDLDDTKLLLEIRQKLNLKKLETSQKVKPSISGIERSLQEMFREDKGTPNNDETLSKEAVNLPTPKRKREGLVQEIIISPRREEDRLQFKEDVKRYKDTKEKLKRQKEQMLDHTKKQKSKPSSKSSKSSKRHKSSTKIKIKPAVPIDIHSETAKKMKETFRSNMASVMVGILNAFRKPDCKQGKITNTEDFKHLARKLTHFVMLKELKHCQDIQELLCTESVKAKAKEFVRKYMSKFGEVYIKPKDDLENY